MTVYGLDISDHSAEMVSLRKQRGMVVLDRFGSAEVPPGVVSKGRIEDPETLAQVLSALFDRVCGPRRGRVRIGLCLPETLVFSGVFQLPAALEPALAAKAASMEAFETFPMSFERIGADAAALPSAGETKPVLYAAADRAVIDSYSSVLREAGADLVFLDIESHALVRALVAGDETAPVMVADIGAKTTVLAVADGGAVRHAASIPLGGNHLTSAIEVKLNVPFEKAEALKRRAGFDPSLDEGRIFFILQSPMMDLIQEIRRTADHYKNMSGRAVGSLLLAGGTSLTPSIVEYLASNLSGMKIQPGQPLRNMRLGSGVKTEEAAAAGIFYATAIGLGLRGLGIAPGPALDLRKTGDISTSAAKKSFWAALRGYATRLRDTASRPAPAPKRRSKRTLVIAGIFALLAVSIVVGMLYSIQRRLSGAGEPLPAPSAAPAAPATVSVTVTVSADTAAGQNPDTVFGRIVNLELTGSGTVTATGSRAADDAKAAGTVSIENTTARTFSFTATTRVLSKEGVLFRLDQPTSIPANGSVRARVSADQAGPAGDIGPSIFIIPGLSADLQARVTARSDAAMTGGSGTVAAVKAEDIAAAKQAIVETLRQKAAADFKAAARDGEAFLPELVLHEELSWNGPAVGAAGPASEASLAVRFAALLVPEAEIRQRLQAQLPAPATLATINYTVSGLATGVRQAVVRAEAEVNPQ